jgi:hypothetical protein
MIRSRIYTTNQSNRISNGDKGDVTVSGSGSTWLIDNGVISFAKMQNISSSRLLGRVTGGAGAVEEITIATGWSAFFGVALDATVSAPGAGQNGFVMSYNHGNLEYELIAPGGAGAPGGAANEVQKNSGAATFTGTKVFSAANGDLTLGDGTVAGDRNISSASSTANADLIISAVGTGDVYFGSKVGGTWIRASSDGGQQALVSSDDFLIQPSAGFHMTFGGAATVNYAFGGTPGAWGTSQGVLAINNRNADPSAAIANFTMIYAKDSSDGAANSTLALYTEQAVEASAVFTQTHRLQIWINGVEYYLPLDTV